MASMKIQSGMVLKLHALPIVVVVYIRRVVSTMILVTW